MSGSAANGWRRCFVAMLVVASAGCASGPASTSLASLFATEELRPAVGESREAVSGRAYIYSSVYAFEIDEHRYELANAADAGRSQRIYELVFIDGELSCSRDRIAFSLSDLDSDLRQWEWVSEPGGLEYLAGRLQQACRPEDSTQPRVWPAAPTPSVTSDHPVQAEDDVAAKGESAQVAGAIAAGTLYGGLAFIPVYGPLIELFVLAVASLSSRPALDASGKSVDDEFSKLRLAHRPEEVLKILGEPNTTFGLAKVGVQVQAFNLKGGHSYFVGVADGRPIWFHADYPWLKQLAMETLDED